MIDRQKLIAQAEKWRELQQVLLNRPVTSEIPRHDLSDVTTRAVGEPLEHSERILLGELNEVHAATTVAGTQLIVRVARGRPHFDDERWAIEAAAAAQAPVPSVLLVEQRDIGDEPVEVCVQARLDCRPLDHVLFAADPPDDATIHSLLAATGEAIRRVHDVPVAGFGHPDANGRAPGDSWATFLLTFCRARDRSRAAAEGNGLSGPLFDKAADLLDAHADIYDGQPPKLVHGDFHPKHVIINGHGNVSGLIDFEACRGGDPIYDIATWDYLQRDTLPLPWLMDGYTRAGNVEDDWQLRVEIYRVLLGLAYVIVAGARLPLWANIGRQNLSKDVERLAAR